MHVAPPPDSRELLPPLIACLPTSFVSPRPPPALLPLLSPLLRQRITYLSDTAGSNGWIPLLQWHSQKAAKLPDIVERIDLEPHPVSGEFELEDVRPAKYRRLDDETLHARLEVDQFEILPIYLWCEADTQAGTEAGWKLAELRALEDIEDGTRWFDSISQANDAANTQSINVPQTTNGDTQNHRYDEEEDDLNDDYWNAYDRTPAARTPAKRSPAPVPSSTLAMSSRREGQSAEDDYYSRYAEEVQPAMDPHDPDEDNEDIGDSTLNGTSHAQSLPQQSQIDTSSGIAGQADYLRSLQPHTEWKQPLPHDSAVHTAMEQSINGEQELSMPRPISPTSSHSSIDKLEERAAEMSSQESDRAQLAIKQHISTDVKSLFRLARASGMNREEFEQVVRRELEVLPLLEQD